MYRIIMLLLLLTLASVFAQADLGSEVEVEALLEQGLEELLCGNSEEAMVIYVEAVELAPDDPEAYFNRALVYQDHTGEFQLALQDLNRAIELLDDNADYYYNRGLARELMGDEEGALDDFSRAESLREVE